MNRIKELLEEPGERPLPAGDYWIVYGDGIYVYVTAETAVRVARSLERWWTPRWITFVDLTGSRIRVRTSTLQGVLECTALQRAATREFERAQRLEQKADRRPWEDDD